MRSPGPAPLFHGKAVLVVYSPDVRDPRVVQAAVHGLVRRVQDNHGTEEELLMGILELIAEYEGLMAHLTGRTDEAIEFSVTKH